MCHGLMVGDDVVYFVYILSSLVVGLGYDLIYPKYTSEYFLITLHRCNEDVKTMLHSGFPTTYPTVFFPRTKKWPTNTKENQSQPGLDRSARPCCEQQLMPDWRCGCKEVSWGNVSRFYGSSSILHHPGKAKVPWPDMISENLFLPQVGHPSRPF